MFLFFETFVQTLMKFTSILILESTYDNPWH